MCCPAGRHAFLANGRLVLFARPLQWLTATHLAAACAAARPPAPPAANAAFAAATRDKQAPACSARHDQHISSFEVVPPQQWGGALKQVHPAGSRGCKQWVACGQRINESTHQSTKQSIGVDHGGWAAHGKGAAAAWPAGRSVAGGSQRGRQAGGRASSTNRRLLARDNCACGARRPGLQHAAPARPSPRSAAAGAPRPASVGRGGGGGCHVKVGASIPRVRGDRRSAAAGVPGQPLRSERGGGCEVAFTSRERS